MQTPDLSFLHYVNELIAINNERFKTYSRAMEKTHDSTFRSLCAQNKERTVHFNMQLIRCLVSYNQLPLHTETDLGKAYHFGMVRRFRFLLRLRRVNRNACLWWDSIALRAYKHVLEDLQFIPGEIKRVILQQQSIQESDRRYSGIAL
jgi:hypothetical protein